MKTIKHEFSLDLYHKAKENPDKYEFVYRDGTKPLGVVYMEGLESIYQVKSWTNKSSLGHTVNGFYSQRQDLRNHDLFILEKAPLTYRSALESLPDGYRELALENAEAQGWRNFNPDDECELIEKAIDRCISWKKTLQGFDFWLNVQRHYINGTPLPPLPVKEEKKETNHGGVSKVIMVDKDSLIVNKQVDQDRLDKFVCAALTGAMANPSFDDFGRKEYIEAVISFSIETIKQLEGGEK